MFISFLLGFSTGLLGMIIILFVVGLNVKKDSSYIDLTQAEFFLKKYLTNKEFEKEILENKISKDNAILEVKKTALDELEKLTGNETKEEIEDLYKKIVEDRK